jgi:hypothetical protein
MYPRLIWRLHDLYCDGQQRDLKEDVAEVLPSELGDSRWYVRTALAPVSS